MYNYMSIIASFCLEFETIFRPFYEIINHTKFVPLPKRVDNMTQLLSSSYANRIFYFSSIK